MVLAGAGALGRARGVLGRVAVPGNHDWWYDGPAVQAGLRRTGIPDIFPSVPRRVALTIAGHSHGGRVSLPFLGRPIIPSPGSARWRCGIYDDGGRKLLVAGEVGTSILAVRLGNTPEIVIVTLRGAP